MDRRSFLQRMVAASSLGVSGLGSRSVFGAAPSRFFVGCEVIKMGGGRARAKLFVSEAVSERVETGVVGVLVQHDRGAAQLRSER